MLARAMEGAPAGDPLPVVQRVFETIAFAKVSTSGPDARRVGYLRDMDGIRCEGTFRRGGRSCPFSFAATRNAATFYPGPLARSAHFAILSLATEGGLPASNPIVFTWRELCSRMGVCCSGRTIRELRAALAATKGLMIESRHALFLKTSEGKEEGDGELSRIVGLYERRIGTAGGRDPRPLRVVE